MAEVKKTGSNAISVGVADKSPLIQAALQQLISQDGRFDLRYVAANGDDFLEQIGQQAIDVGVTGWVIAPADARFILDHLQNHDNAPKIIVYTGSDSDGVPSKAMAHGAAAFVSKSEQPSFLLDTIASVAEGHMVFPYLDVRKIHDNPLSSLTRRELEVLSDLAAGRTNKQIAREQGVSLNTVKFHVRNLFQKLGVNSRSQAISLYLQS
jgi:two-component system nitrate/nitrite response regulator NarP